MNVHRTEIGRIEDSMIPVVFSDGETVGDLLRKAGISLGSDEAVITLGGDTVEQNELASEGIRSYVVTKNYKNGFNWLRLLNFKKHIYNWFFECSKNKNTLFIFNMVNKNEM